jgi:outer membrane lipoprotein-sorting protein
MLKHAVTFTLNRVFFLAVVAVLVSGYAQNACHLGGTSAAMLEQALSGLKDVTRALQ